MILPTGIITVNQNAIKTHKYVKQGYSMTLANFNRWIEQKRLLQEAIDNPLLDMKQEEGDKVYFGIHDLDRYYKVHNGIPSLEYADIMDKAGEITEVDPVESNVLVSVSKDPFHFGYHNLENKSQRDRRKKRGENVKLPASSLIDISHLIDGEHKVWLVVDSKTKYQSGLMKQIRRKEMRSYMDKEAGEVKYMLDDEDNPLDLGIEVGYKMSNREVEPYYQFNNKPLFDPSIQKTESSWKYHSDTKKYDYYPE